ncbi:molybdopterin synthase catalytic subunit [Hyphobacterium marinum]|uniref:Molybdopterin synthase catalytic subunit n=1 Tax=Hyphobacterium marinum TaxID=3116574 RepID=A0ABU7LU52_9PROT|nr:molybdenum cofactor biosynthesis protein MoaE [Hyphobacterium sp. Y6023]MEE2565101.1 molybdenum cofactor biosynthesis protein MoaE [Hyphobacterium sp. Y6023]
MTRSDIVLTGECLDIEALNRRLQSGVHSGAVSTFTGLVRSSDALTALELLHHRVLTPAALQRIAKAAMNRFGVADLLIAHRYGRMAVGEPIVHIAGAAPHRRAALDCVSYAIDVLKTQAPFWKREWRGDKYDWVEPTLDDHEKAATWMETDT